ncbi:MAG: ion transporter [Prosthecobacter sp.]|uniref:ion transporter n=1 Tax=Prosthecobacter sp. TaxID=1965333 RepID=UPI0019EE8D8F|nr:ion transporter [Prosthecobacter sp.]MBE2281854.1 ion transporter [Prosthecobacter sp.]
MSATPEANPRRETLWRIIFLSDTRPGRAFDVALIVLILLSVGTLMLESVDELREAHGRWFSLLEWTLTGLFTLEYLARLWVVRRSWSYALSFFGLVDLVSILPSYLELLVPDTHYLMTFRVLRLLRMFRILKLAEYSGEANVLLNALKASRRKIAVFFMTVMTLVLIEGTVMYVIEHDENAGFRNIPQSIYWAIVTLTTVGYGDVAPVTVLGKMMASVIMLTGFTIIAVPTGIVTQEIGREMRGAVRGPFRRCRECGWQENDPSARFCQQCGTRLEM